MKGPPHIIARLRLLPAAEGGRASALPDLPVFMCIFDFQGEKFDCGLMLTEIGGAETVKPGVEVTIPIGFLFPQLIVARLKRGDRFTLWELKTIAEGVVDSVPGEVAQANSCD